MYELFKREPSGRPRQWSANLYIYIYIYNFDFNVNFATLVYDVDQWPVVVVWLCVLWSLVRSSFGEIAWYTDDET